jgi:hypothetical protein
LVPEFLGLVVRKVSDSVSEKGKVDVFEQVNLQIGVLSNGQAVKDCILKLL